jgi:single-strand DNA-binding protein
MADTNVTVICGRLTRDPESRNVGESSVTAMSLACSKKYKTKSGEAKEETLFIDTECWGKTGELVQQYLKKGSQCVVVGRLKLDVWEKEGQKQSKIKLVAEQVQFVGGKSESGEAYSGGGSAKHTDNSKDDDVMPF